MDILIKSAKIIDKNSPFHNQIKDIFIEKKNIKNIGDELTVKKDTQIIEGENLHVSIGWFDLKANFREPGEEWIETINTGVKAAKKGGFTGVGVSPDTKTPLDNSSQIEFIRNRAKKQPVNLFPYGAISSQLKGENLAEIGDMKEAGAIAFTDDKKNLSIELLSRALLYGKTFNALSVVFPFEPQIAKNGQIHEGIVSTKMGVKPIPALAETIQVQRNLALALYHDCPIHFSTISTKQSVDLIRDAKKQGIKVTCDIAAHQLFFTDQNAINYDSNYKVLPPFRGKNDITALIKGLKDGTVDAICSDHQPHDIESKKVEFEQAKFGIIGLETAFGCLHTVLMKNLPLEKIIELITTNPRIILGLKVPRININEKAELTVFDPTEKWVFEENYIQSKSKNTPFIGEEFTGKPLYTIN